MTQPLVTGTPKNDESGWRMFVAAGHACFEAELVTPERMRYEFEAKVPVADLLSAVDKGGSKLGRCGSVHELEVKPSRMDGWFGVLLNCIGNPPKYGPVQHVNACIYVPVERAALEAAIAA